MSNRILFLVDVQNLFYSAKDLYGQDARIDFKKLLDLVKNKELSKFKAIVYIEEYQEDNDTFIKVFNRLGFEIGSKSKLESDLMEQYKDYETVVVASGRGNLLDNYKQIKKDNVKVHVISFSNSINSKLPPIVDKLTLINDSILFVSAEKTIES